MRALSTLTVPTAVAKCVCRTGHHRSLLVTNAAVHLGQGVFVRRPYGAFDQHPFATFLRVFGCRGRERERATEGVSGILLCPFCTEVVCLAGAACHTAFIFLFMIC
ncbi:unnamed protein product [Ceratitis capitata]|uniref:(Mediterranean fruit fly) hypothetical protein n=1 Tax=Ceratitis capitata TaxID=7213 RepID=A0A811V849_CERCA|nr:unnamed protein product [Ceratitis capitata]